MKFDIIFIIFLLFTSINQIKSLTEEDDDSFYPHIFITVTVYYNNLSSGQIFNLYQANTPNAEYRILAINSVAGLSSNFTGGDRYLSIGTNTEEKWIITPTSLNSCGYYSLTQNTVDIGIQSSFNSIPLSLTGEGQNITVQYSGGTTDYTSGSICLSIYIFQSDQ